MDTNIVIPVLTSTKHAYIFSYDFITLTKPCEDLTKTFQCRCSSEICSISHWFSTPGRTENSFVQLPLRQVPARKVPPPTGGHRPGQAGARGRPPAGGDSGLGGNHSRRESGRGRGLRALQSVRETQYLPRTCPALVRPGARLSLLLLREET